MDTQVKLSWAHREEKSETDPDTGLPFLSRVSAVFDFSKKGFGFGEITIVTDGNGQTFIDAETMSRKTVIGLLTALVEEAILDTEKDPEKHAQYNEAMRSTCGSNCEICAKSLT